MKNYKPIVLVILDGWGESEKEEGNAIAVANLSTTEMLNKNYPKILLEASGLAAGLPWGEAGNSEVGHQTIGSGQVNYQNLPRISMAIENGSFFKNPVLMETMEQVKKSSGALHLMGLLSDGGVHSHMDHLFALLDMVKNERVKQVFIHVITDGRDTSPTSAAEFVEQLQDKLSYLGIGRIATVSGRYYAMDRNENYDRIEEAFKAMVLGEGILVGNAIDGLQQQYEKKVTDEFIKPMVILSDRKEPVAKILDNDTVIFFNFREDRARQISRAFVQPEFDKFPSAKNRPKNIKFISMTQYEKDLPVKVVFPPREIELTLGKILSKEGKKQLRIGETEKYAHVTYFFNAGKEKAYSGEERILVPSKNAPSYDQVPQMSAEEINHKVLAEIEKEKYDFILINYANPDMVGHTGNFEAGIKAVEFVDQCLGQLVDKVLEKGGCLLVTADHGNCEEMVNPKTGEIDTEHSCNPVPFWFVAPDNKKEREVKGMAKADGMLSDIAPTVLELMGIEKPVVMTGESLLSSLSD